MPALLPSSGTTNFARSAMKKRLRPPAYVYQVTNQLNGKRYIGVTTTSLKRRWAAHVKHDPRKSSLTAAIRKYGPQAFQMITLLECETAYQAYEEEKRYIAALRPEYNRTNGGDGALSNNPRVRSRHLSSFFRGRDQACERRKRPVVCLTDGRRWPSIRAAAEACGALESEVGASCRGLHRYVKGLRFAYDLPNLDIKAEVARRDALQKYRKGFPKPPRRKTQKRQRRGPIVDLNTGMVYRNAAEAAEATGRRNGQISHACMKKTVCRDGSMFRFIEDTEYACSIAV